MPQLHLPRLPQGTLAHSHFSVLQMFLFYALPLSVVPPAMIYFAGVVYGGTILPALSKMQLLSIGIAFFLAELAMTFLVAYIVLRLGEVVDLKIAHEDAYKLAVVIPTPLWLASLCLFVPSVILNIAAGATALMLSCALIFYTVPAILKVADRGSARILSNAILVAGILASAAMMLLTILSWTFVTTSLFS